MANQTDSMDWLWDSMDSVLNAPYVETVPLSDAAQIIKKGLLEKAIREL